MFYFLFVILLFLLQILGNDYAHFAIKNSLLSDLYRVFYYQLFHEVFPRQQGRERSSKREAYIYLLLLLRNDSRRYPLYKSQFLSRVSVDA